MSTKKNTGGVHLSIRILFLAGMVLFSGCARLYHCPALCPEGQVMMKADGKDACFTPGVYYTESTVISK